MLQPMKVRKGNFPSCHGKIANIVFVVLKIVHLRTCDAFIPCCFLFFESFKSQLEIPTLLHVALIGNSAEIYS